MPLKTVAIIAPGDMGHAVGMRLRTEGNLKVLTSLTGRSERSHNLAKQAGLINVDNDEALVREADMLISIVPPGRAKLLADRMAKAIKAAGKNLLYVDMNAIAPQTARDIEKLVTAAGGRFMDGGIMGGAPVEGMPAPRMFISGKDMDEVMALNDHGLNVAPAGKEAGQASGLKMCFASVAKGMVALGLEAMTAARILGVDDLLRQQFEKGPFFKAIERRMPDAGPNAYRWAEEMDEIAATMASTNVEPGTFKGIGDFFRFVEKTPLGKETQENIVLGATSESVIKILAEEATAASKKTTK